MNENETPEQPILAKQSPLVDVDETVRSAVAAFGHLTDDPMTALCLRIMQLERHSQERVDLMNCNARQAKTIAQLERRLSAERTFE